MGVTPLLAEIAPRGLPGHAAAPSGRRSNAARYSQSPRGCVSARAPGSALAVSNECEAFLKLSGELTKSSVM